MITCDQDQRRSILRHVLINGLAWEKSNAELIAQVSKQFTKKRLGAKAAKAAEKLQDVGVTRSRAGNYFPSAGGQGELSCPGPTGYWICH